MLLINCQKTPKKTTSSGLASQFLNGDNLISDPYEISCGFNTFFAYVGASLSKKMNNT